MKKVVFKKSGQETIWDGSKDSLLELGEELGLDLDFSCRQGSCTACQQRITSGKVIYPEQPTASPDPGHELLCCSIPTTDVEIDA